MVWLGGRTKTKTTGRNQTKKRYRNGFHRWTTTPTAKGMGRPAETEQGPVCGGALGLVAMDRDDR